jgi:hypothetical protein
MKDLVTAALVLAIVGDIRIASQGGGTAAGASPEPPEEETDYPEPDMFGNIPAYGLSARHVKAFAARDLIFTADKETF